jgi:hypothetical protein
MRKDLIGAKAYKIGYKLIGDMYHRFETVDTFEEATKRMKEYAEKGWNPIIKAVK